MDQLLRTGANYDVQKAGEFVKATAESAASLTWNCRLDTKPSPAASMLAMSVSFTFQSLKNVNKNVSKLNSKRVLTP